LLKSHAIAHYKWQVPYGFVYQGNVLVEVPGEQETIRLIKDLRDSGKSLRVIARELNRGNVPTKNNGNWQANTVKKIMDRLNFLKGSNTTRAAV
jgi:hypothetical protein